MSAALQSHQVGHVLQNHGFELFWKTYAEIIVPHAMMSNPMKKFHPELDPHGCLLTETNRFWMKGEVFIPKWSTFLPESKIRILGDHHDTPFQNAYFRGLRAHRGVFPNTNNHYLSFITTLDDVGPRTARKTAFVDCCVMVAPISGIPDSGFDVTSTWNLFGVGIQSKILSCYRVIM